MVSIKTEEEITLMREAGRITALAHEAVANAIVEGVTTEQLEKIAEEVILSHGAIPAFKGEDGFPANICTSINEIIVHGIPCSTKLKNGDIISIDIGANYKGYFGDCAKTHPVGAISLEAKQLLEVTQQSLFEGLKMVKPGNRLGDISHAIQTYGEKYGYSIPIEYGGHGIGSQLHEEPHISNVGDANTGIILEEGMCLAIEPMLICGKPHTRVLKDGFTIVSKDRTLAAHFEHTVLVTKEGYEILTTLSKKEDDGNG